MKSASLLAALLFLAAASARGQDEPPAPPPVKRAKAIEPRKFANGRLVDPYWGVTYELAGLEEKKDAARGLLLAGKCGRVQIDVGVLEFRDELGASERRDADHKKWDEKKRIVGDWAQGDEPVVWATYTGEAPSGPKRFEAWSWTTRGCRAFTVHAYVLADAEGGLAAVKEAVGKLVVGPETGAAVQVQLLAKAKGLAYDDVAVLDAAASAYLQDGKDGFPAIAEGLERAAIEGVPGSRYEKSYGEVFGMYQRLGQAQMLLGKYDDALATYVQCAAVAEKTERPGPAGAAVQYDVACACSRLGRIDDAFAALDKAWARAADWGPPVPDEHLVKDPDLENCRKDPRWAKFMETKPKKS
jgi:tetratricopeptide (TPR) repeat protein